MARKSNKTAHVLNLLAGQNPSEDTENEKEPVQAEEGAPSSKSPASASAAPAAASTQSPQSAPADMPSSISIIDNGAEEDPVAEKIREELLKSLDEAEVTAPAPKEEATVHPQSEPEPVPQPEVAPATKEEATAEPQTEPAPAPQPEVAPAPKVEAPAEPQTEPVPAPQPEVAPATKEEATVEPQTKPEPVTQSAPITQPEDAPAPKEETPVEPQTEPAPAPEPEEILDLKEEPPAEPEPDYVMLNVMKEIVEDKIIYFMKQFEVCTCDKCKADTIALTLNGLPAKYKIVEKAAAAPLVSFYASRLISQVTVEALKACTQVKENPRH